MAYSSRLQFTVGSSDLVSDISTNGDKQLVELDATGLLVVAAVDSKKVIGALFIDAAAGEEATVITNEVVTLRSAEAIAPGQKVMVDETDAEEVQIWLNTDDSDEVIGVALTAASAGDEFIEVKLNF